MRWKKHSVPLLFGLTGGGRGHLSVRARGGRSGLAAAVLVRLVTSWVVGWVRGRGEKERKGEGCGLLQVGPVARGP